MAYFNASQSIYQIGQECLVYKTSNEPKAPGLITIDFDRHVPAGIIEDNGFSDTRITFLLDGVYAITGTLVLDGVFPDNTAIESWLELNGDTINPICMQADSFLHPPPTADLLLPFTTVLTLKAGDVLSWRIESVEPLLIKGHVDGTSLNVIRIG